MKSPLLHLLILFICNICPFFNPSNAAAEPEGTVAYTLEWHTGRQVYTYVFSGLVSRRGRPCPNAKILLQISTPNEQDKIQETLALADGTYELIVALSGAPSQSAEWKLVAQASEIGSETTEIEGRTILTENENQVQVHRGIQLVQG